MERLDSTPKLLLSRLPSKASREPIIMQTPPVSKLASIPFQWEEVPGKPRPPYNKIPAAVRCLELELPPRLLNNNSVKVSPDDDQNMCQSSKGLFVGLVKDVVKEGKDYDEGEVEEKSKRMKFGDSFRSFGSFNNKGSLKGQKSGVKICNSVRRKSSFLGISHATSTLWAGIYGSFKQVVPWRWRQQ